MSEILMMVAVKSYCTRSSFSVNH